jgi:hypothetical protein
LPFLGSDLKLQLPVSVAQRKPREWSIRDILQGTDSRDVPELYYSPIPTFFNTYVIISHVVVPIRAVNPVVESIY